MAAKNKEFGYFDDAEREFVITSPKTPYPWINYSGDRDFFSLISQTAGGYSFYKDAKFRRLTRYRYNGIPTDNGGRYFYIKDGSEIWNPGWMPCRTPLDSYECRHGMGYTRITGSKNALEASVLFFVPLKENCEIQKLTLTNNSSDIKHASLWSFTEWCLWNAETDMENFQRNFSTGEVEIENNVIYHKTEYRERRNHYAFYSVNAEIDGFDTDRESFLGAYNGLDLPETVMNGISRNSVAHGWSPVASHRIDMTLAPGESRTFIFILGYIENSIEEKFATAPSAAISSSSPIINKEKALRVILRYSQDKSADDAFYALKEYWTGLLSKFQAETGVREFDRMINIWNQYQCVVTFHMSRSASFFESGIGRGMGFRDSNQDLAGFVHQMPEMARQRILDIAATQFPDGGCYHQYQPLTKRGNNGIGGGFNDDPLWLIFGTVAYIKETGDTDILREMVPFDNKPGSEKSLLEHLRRSFKHVTDNLGPHGLPLIGRADWNDCLNLNCFSDDPDESYQTTENKTEGSKAESLMIAGLFVREGREWAGLLRHIGPEKAEDIDPDAVDKAVSDMEDAVKRYGWDGDWFLRAYDYSGRKVGSHENEEGKIFIESQGWCSMARIGAEEGMCAKALDSAKKYLDSPYGLVLNNPAFTTWIKDYGEISSYPPGYKENAGIFCHNNPWIIIGEVLEGRAEDAWDHYRKICPAFITDQLRHKVEPYVYCQMVSGKDAPLPGEGKNSWLTGTAAWNWVTASEYLLGVRPDYDGLEIRPCLPAGKFCTIRIKRAFRDAFYDLTIHNSGRGDKSFIKYAPGYHKLTIDL